jgi:hypothetical protein
MKLAGSAVFPQVVVTLFVAWILRRTLVYLVLTAKPVVLAEIQLSAAAKAFTPMKLGRSMSAVAILLVVGLPASGDLL